MAEFPREDANEFAVGIRSAEQLAYHNGMTPQDVAEALTQIATAILKSNYDLPDDEMRGFLFSAVEFALVSLANTKEDDKCLH